MLSIPSFLRLTFVTYDPLTSKSWIIVNWQQLHCDCPLYNAGTNRCYFSFICYSSRMHLKLNSPNKNDWYRESRMDNRWILRWLQGSTDRRNVILQLKSIPELGGRGWYGIWEEQIIALCKIYCMPEIADWLHYRVWEMIISSILKIAHV